MNMRENIYGDCGSHTYMDCVLHASKQLEEANIDLLQGPFKYVQVCIKIMTVWCRAQVG